MSTTPPKLIQEILKSKEFSDETDLIICSYNIKKSVDFRDILISKVKNLFEGICTNKRNLSRFLEDYDNVKASIDHLNLLLEYEKQNNYLKRVIYYSEIILAIYKIVNKKLDIAEKECIISESMRRELIESRRNIAEETIDYFLEIQSRTNFKKYDIEIQNNIKQAIPIYTVDHIIFCNILLFFSNTQDTSSKDIDRIIDKTKETIDIILTFKNDLSSTYISKAYRHLAFFYIQQKKYTDALICLSISTIYIRYIGDENIREELIKKRFRGYAQLYYSNNQTNFSDSIIDGKGLKKKEIRAFIFRKSDQEVNEIDCKINLAMIRHAERQRDADGIFGFKEKSNTNNGTINTPIDATTDGGNAEFSKLLDRFKNTISKKYSKFVIISSDNLKNKEAILLKNSLTSSEKDLKVEVLSTDHLDLNPIDVGYFNGLKEDQAKNKYPGEYQILTKYRTKQNNGFELTFPKGENVLDFEKRIASIFFKILLNQISDKNFDIINTLFIFLGHTSTITALLNIINYISKENALNEPNYTFYSIDTSTIINGEIDFQMHQSFLETSKEFVF